jgi:hypothetical protein
VVAAEQEQGVRIIGLRVGGESPIGRSLAPGGSAHRSEGTPLERLIGVGMPPLLTAPAGG